MIGFVEVEIDRIKKAYNYIKQDIDKPTPPEMEKKLKKLSAIINNDSGRRLFSQKEKLRVKMLLHELVYSSLVTTANHMLLRIEVASLIQDIISLYEDNEGRKQ